MVKEKKRKCVERKKEKENEEKSIRMVTGEEEKER